MALSLYRTEDAAAPFRFTTQAPDRLFLYQRITGSRGRKDPSLILQRMVTVVLTMPFLVRTTLQLVLRLMALSILATKVPTAIRASLSRTIRDRLGVPALMSALWW